MLAAAGAPSILSWPPVGDALLGYVENQARAAAAGDAALLLRRDRRAGRRHCARHPPEREFPSLTEAPTACGVAARLYKQGVAPRIIVSGGGVPRPEMTDRR